MAKSNIVTLDFESFWSQTHSLTKMSPIEYVMHEDTEIISLAMKVNNDRTEVAFGYEIPSLIDSVDWSNAFALGHNLEGFDSMILAWRYGVNPKLWMDTMQMARYLGHAKTTGLSLKALTQHYGLGVKDATALTNTKGKHLKDFTPAEIADMREYNKEDVELTFRLFKTLAPRIPSREMVLADKTIRMLTNPQFDLDTQLLEKTLVEERERKHFALVDVAYALDVYEVGQTEEETAEAARALLASAPKFAEFLTKMGVDVPMKPSPTNPEKMTYALAKTDEAFTDLTSHENPMVAAAAQARLGVKSTILETRIEAFLQAGNAVGGKLPVPLKFYGADTTGRWSGWAYNPQNLSRIDPSKPKPSDALRLSLRAPKGYKVVVADLSGIELRVNMFLWRVPYAMELFRRDPEKADLYKALAAELFKILVEEVQKMQRQLGKGLHLGCGFGLGTPSKFVTVCKTMTGLDITPEDAKTYIAGYREAHPEIVQGWKTCHQSLACIYEGSDFTIDPWGMCTTTPEGIKTPQGMIRYPDLRQELNEKGKPEWVYGQGRNKARIYAGKVTENIVQHLAREVIADNLLQISELTRYDPVLAVHDELVYLAPESEAEDLLATVQSVMRTPPKWWPELITWSEGDIADTYGAAK